MRLSDIIPLWMKHIREYENIKDTDRQIDLLDIQRLMKTKYTLDQVGFVPGQGTQINLWYVIEFARNRAPNKQMIFIDLSNAYNSVNREKLNEIIIQRKWMDKEAADFLMTLYEEMFFLDPIKKIKIFLKNGVHQGSLIAPILFNLYFNKLLIEWRTKTLLWLQN
ncbi:unnamed protein product [Paramecium sonneborni]|uniref:Reverse transcriptase domain-containing protein n=1 Tax=Paramecium sonneborni TaxID=65129 RepID=A0A8S1M7G3_9CILI|nr:unnamed protein product [Paramecium sonneborni]